MSDIEISIIIPSRNVRDDLKKCLTSVFENLPCNTEVIVSDGNSSDGTSEMVQRDFPEVKLVRFCEPGSYASSINRGIKASCGHYLIFLDSDVIINSNTIPGMLDFLKSCPRAGAVVCKTFYPDGSLQYTVKKFPTPLNSLFGRETILTRLFPKNRISRNYLMADKFQQSEPFEIDCASSACMMIRRDVLKNSGFFDEGFLFYWADVDYCRSLRDGGWNIYFIPEVSVVHDMSNNADKKKSSFAIRAFHKGVYRYFRKHCTRCDFHPMNFVAWVGLNGRACVLILLNWLKPDKRA